MTNGPIEQLGAEARELEKPNSELKSLTDLKWDENNIDELITFLSNESNNNDFAVVSDGKKLSVDSSKKRVGSQFLVNDANWKSYSFASSSSQQAVLLPFLSQKNKEGGRRILDKENMENIRIPSYMTPSNIKIVNEFDEMLANGKIGKDEVEKFEKDMEALKAVFAQEFDNALDAVIESLKEVEDGQAVNETMEGINKIKHQVEANKDEPIKFKDLDKSIQAILIAKNKVGKDSQEYFTIKRIENSKNGRVAYDIYDINNRFIYSVTDTSLKLSSSETVPDVSEANKISSNERFSNFTPEVRKAQDNDLKNKYEDLETGVMKDISDKMPRNMKQSLRWIFQQKHGVSWSESDKESDLLREIYDDVRDINLIHALNIYNKDPNFDFSGKVSDVKQRLKEVGYEKEGWFFGRREVKNLESFFNILSNSKNPEVVVKVLEYVKGAVSGGMNHVDIVGFKRMIDALDTKSLDNNKVLKLLIGDLNYDGDIVNLKKGENQSRVDKGRILGGQIQKAYELAVEQHGEDIVAKNIGSLVGLEVGNLEDLTTKLKMNPGKVNQLRKMMQVDSDSIGRMFEMGNNYAIASLEEAFRRQETEEQKLSIIKGLIDKLPGELKDKLDEKLKNLLQKDVAQRDEEIQKIRTEIKLLDPVKDKDHIANLKKLDEMLTTINKAIGEGGDINSLPSSIKRGFYLAALGAAYSDISVDGAKFQGLSLGAAVSHDGFNEALSDATAKIIDNMTLGGGLYKDLNTNAIGFGMSLTAGGSQKLSNTTTLFYSGGAARSPLKPGNITPVGSIGLDEFLNKKSLQKTLDYRSGQHATLTGTVTPGNVTLQAAWSRDKKEGILIGHEHLQQQSEQLFSDLLSAKDLEERQTKLKELFPNTSTEQVSYIARSLEYTLAHYNAVLTEEGKPPSMLAKRLGDAFARERLNQGMEQISREGLHISQVGGGVSLFKAFTGFLGLASIRISNYKDTTVQEKLENYQKNLNEGRGLDRVNVPSIDEKLAAIKKELGLESNLTYNKENHTIRIPGTILDTVRVSLAKQVMKGDQLEDFKNYVKTSDGDLIIPASATLTARNGLRSEFSEKFLIIGRTDAAGAEQISSFDGLDGAPENYGEIKEHIIISEAKMTMDSLPSEAIMNAVDDHASEIARLRLKGGMYRAFHSELINYVNNNENLSNKDSVNKFKDQFGSTGILDNLIKSVTSTADIRYIHASFSKVSQTEYKHLDASKFEHKAKDLLSKFVLPEAYDGIIDRAKNGNLTEKDINYLRSASGVTSMKPATSPEQKFAYLLLPLSHVVEARLKKYEDSLDYEIREGRLTENGKRVLIEARKNSVNNLKNISIGRGESLKIEGSGGENGGGSDQMLNVLASISGYGKLNDEKYVQHPRVVPESLVSIDNEDVRRHYFTKLKDQDPDKFNDVVESFKDMCKKAKIGEGVIDTLTGESIIDALATQKTGDANLDVKLMNGIYVDCLNDALMFAGVSIQNKVTEKEKGDLEVYVGDVMSDNVLDTRRIDIGLAAAFGTLTRKDGSGTTPETQDSENESENDSSSTTPETLDGEALKKYVDNVEGTTVKEVPGGSVITVGGVSYEVAYHTDAAGNQLIVYQKGNTTYVVTNTGGSLSLNKVTFTANGYSIGEGQVLVSPPTQEVDGSPDPMVSKSLSEDSIDPTGIAENIRFTQQQGSSKKK